VPPATAADVQRVFPVPQTHQKSHFGRHRKPRQSVQSIRRP
jgi:hypothetical protein